MTWTTFGEAFLMVAGVIALIIVIWAVFATAYGWWDDEPNWPYPKDDDHASTYTTDSRSARNDGDLDES